MAGYSDDPYYASILSGAGAARQADAVGEPEGPSGWQQAGAFASRLGGPLVGGALGGAAAGSAVFPGLGTAAGALIGAGLGGVAGELGGEAILGEEFKPGEVALAGGLAAIPAGPFGRAAAGLPAFAKAAEGVAPVLPSLAKQIGLHIAEGGVQGAIGTGARSIYEQRIPTAAELGANVLGGAALGGVLGGGIGAYQNRTPQLSGMLAQAVEHARGEIGDKATSGSMKHFLRGIASSSKYDDLTGARTYLRTLEKEGHATPSIQELIARLDGQAQALEQMQRQAAAAPEPQPAPQEQPPPPPQEEPDFDIEFPQPKQEPDFDMEFAQPAEAAPAAPRGARPRYERPLIQRRLPGGVRVQEGAPLQLAQHDPFAEPDFDVEFAQPQTQAPRRMPPPAARGQSDFDTEFGAQPPAQAPPDLMRDDIARAIPAARGQVHLILNDGSLATVTPAELDQILTRSMGARALSETGPRLDTSTQRFRRGDEFNPTRTQEFQAPQELPQAAERAPRYEAEAGPSDAELEGRRLADISNQQERARRAAVPEEPRDAVTTPRGEVDVQDAEVEAELPALANTLQKSGKLGKGELDAMGLKGYDKRQVVTAIKRDADNPVYLDVKSRVRDAMERHKRTTEDVSFNPEELEGRAEPRKPVAVEPGPARKRAVPIAQKRATLADAGYPVNEMTTPQINRAYGAHMKDPLAARGKAVYGTKVPRPEPKTLVAETAPEYTPAPQGPKRTRLSQEPPALPRGETVPRPPARPRPDAQIEDLTARGFDAERIAADLGVSEADVLAVRQERGIPPKRIRGKGGEIEINPEFQAWLRRRKAVPTVAARVEHEVVAAPGHDIEGAAASRARLEKQRAAEAAEQAAERQAGVVPKGEEPLSQKQAEALAEYMTKNHSDIERDVRMAVAHGVSEEDARDAFQNLHFRKAQLWDEVRPFENYVNAGRSRQQRVYDIVREAKARRGEVSLDALASEPGMEGRSQAIEAEASAKAAERAAPATPEAEPVPEEPVQAKDFLTPEEQIKILDTQPTFTTPQQRAGYRRYLELKAQGVPDDELIETLRHSLANLKTGKLGVTRQRASALVRDAEAAVYGAAGRAGEGQLKLRTEKLAEMKAGRAQAAEKVKAQVEERAGGPVSRPKLPELPGEVGSPEHLAALRTWAKENEQGIKDWFATQSRGTTERRALRDFGDQIGKDVSKNTGANYRMAESMLRHLHLAPPRGERGSIPISGLVPEWVQNIVTRLRAPRPARASTGPKAARQVVEQVVAKRPPKPLRTVKPKPIQAESVLRRMGGKMEGAEIQGPQSPNAKPYPREENVIEAAVNTQHLDLNEAEKKDLIALARVNNPALARAVRRTTKEMKLDAYEILANHSEDEFIEQVRRRHQNLTDAESYALRSVLAGQAKRMTKAKLDLQGSAPGAGRDAAEKAFLEELGRSSAVLGMVANDGTDTARALAFRRVLAAEMDPNISRRGLLGSALRSAKVDKADIAKILTQYDGVLNGTVTAETLRRLVQHALNSKMGPLDKWLTFYKAGLLTPASIAANFGSNALHYTMTGSEERLAGLLDRARVAAFGGQREVYSLPTDIATDALHRVLKRALPRLLNDHARIVALKSLPLDLRGAAVQDIRRFGPAFSGKKGEFIESMFKSLDSGDAFWKDMIREREMTKIAHREAMHTPELAGLKGKALLEKVNAIKDQMEQGLVPENRAQFKRWEKDWKQITQAMEDGTFQTEMKGGLVRQAFHGIQELTANVPALQFIIPFLRTPGNIAIETAKRTPVALIAKLLRTPAYLRAIKDGTMTYAQLENDMAKPMVGSALMGLMYMLGQNGQLSGGGPQDPRKEQALRATGWQPYSIKIGDKYVGYQRFEPLSSIIGFAADMSEAMKDGDTKTAAKLAEKVSASIGENLTNKTFLSGLEGLTTAFSDPERYMKRFVKQQQGALVPNTIGYLPFGSLARALDPTFRETEAFTTSPFQAKIPGLSQRLPAQLTPSGEERVRPETLGPRLLSPIPFSREKQGPEADVARAMIRSGYVPSMPPKYVTIAGKRVDLDSAEQRKLAGAQRDATAFIAKRVAKDPTFQRMPVNEEDPRYRMGMKTQRDVLTKIYRRYRRQALTLMHGGQLKRAIAQEAQAETPESRERQYPY